MEKRPWKRPELIVLVRGRPDEAVLAACKAGGFGGPEAAGCKKASGSGACAGQKPS